MVGLIGLIIVVLAVTFTVRRRRQKRLMDEALSFDPTSSRTYLDDVDNEKPRSSVGHASDGGYVNGQYPMPLPPRNVYQEHAGYGVTPFPPYSHAQAVDSHMFHDGGHPAFQVQPLSDRPLDLESETFVNSPPPLHPVLPDAFGERDLTGTPDMAGPPVPLKV